MISEFSEKEKLTNSEKVTMEDSWAGLHELPGLFYYDEFLDLFDLFDSFEEKQVAKDLLSARQECPLPEGKL